MYVNPSNPPPAVPVGRSPKGRVRIGRVFAGIAVIVLLAVPSLVGALIVLVAGNLSQRNEPVADGRAPGELTFPTEAKRYVVALSAKPGSLLDGKSRMERRAEYRVRDGEVSATRCTLVQPDGSTSELRGDRQAVSETIGSEYATVAEFDGQAGSTKLACRFEPAQDLLGTVTETPLMVHELNTAVRVAQYGLLGAMIVFAGVGTLLILWGTVWRRPRKA